MEPRIATELGELPASWRAGPLGEFLSDAQYGASVKGGASGGFPILRMTNQVNGRISPANLQYANVSARELQAFRVERGDILFNRTNSFELVGRTAIFDLDGDYIFASYLIRLRTLADTLDPFFLNVYLNAAETQRRLKSIATRAVSQSNISASRLRGFVIPIPPIGEQRKISQVLRMVQQAMEQQERLIALTTELKKALLHQLFTRGLRGEPQKQTEVGSMPQSWGVATLGDLFDTQLGKMLSQKARTGHDPKPYLRNKNVQWGDIDTTDLLSMDFDERERRKFVLVPGDLLVCEGGEPGRAAIWHGEVKECYYQKALHRLRPKSQSGNNEFLAYWLEFALRYQDLYGVAGASSTIAHLPEVQLKMLPVPLPTRSEVGEIVECLNSVDNRIAVLQRKHAALIALYRTLLHQLMTAHLRVDDLVLSELDALQE